MIDFLMNPNIGQQAMWEQECKTTSTIATIPIGGIYINLDNMLADAASLRSLLIIRNPKICQGRPTILGTRIAVSNIVELHYLLKWDMQKIRDEYPYISEEQITAALEYYENHTKEIDNYLQEEKEIMDDKDKAS